MTYLDDTFINLMNINSLSMWVHHFPSFAESVRKKHCSHWEEEDNRIEEAENSCENQGPFNACGLKDASVFEITRFGSGPADKGPNQPRRSNSCIKQSSICENHKKCHGLIALNISHLNGMSMITGAVSATRN